MGKVFFVLLSFFYVFNGYTSENKYIKLDKNSSFFIDSTGIPIKALPAIQFSFAMLDSILSSDVPIRVSVDFSSTSRKEVIATGVASSYEIGFSDLANPKFYYPISLAEKISGKELNGSDKADINVVVNQELNWFYDTENVCNGTEFDFITLFTHEIIHGLGFQSLIQVRSNVVDTAILPSIYDSFVTDSSGLPIYPDYYKKGPEEAFSLLTSSSLFFTSNYFQNLFVDSRAPLYAPNIFATGNSIHHLNFQDGFVGPYRLMRPGFSPGEYQHYIDPYTREILHAIGWNRPSIQISKQYDVDTVSSGQILKLNVPQTILDLCVEYSFDQFKNYKSIIPECVSGKCTVTIPALEFTHSVNYRLKYADKVFGDVTIPCETCSIAYFVGEDTIKPLISNFYISTLFVDSKEASIGYQVSDNSGFVDIYLVVRQSGKMVDSICLSCIQSQTDNYIYKLPSLSESDILNFTLIATDKSKNKNSNTVKNEIKVLPLGDICYTYTTDFENSENDFTLNGFSICMNSGFNSKSLDSKHPYNAPNQDQDSLFTTAILKPRIIIDHTHYFMSFDEIVMVEPHEVGKVFGEFGFWDFVSVEASKDNGVTWHILGKEGYDATNDDVWSMSYLNNVIITGRNKNSMTIPTVDMYRNHTINLVENKYLQKGDTVMIRFMLTSDAFSTGWGWSIDNLVVQEGAGVNVPRAEDIISIYPNPFSSEILFSENIDNASYRIVSILGETAQAGCINGNSLATKNLPNGLYLIYVDLNGVTYTKSIAKFAQ